MVLGYQRMKGKHLNGIKNHLGLCYENGTSIEKDLDKAFHWYQKAADNGNKVAQYNLGRYYYYGKCVEKDEVKALKWYKKSAEQEYSNAQSSLGLHYEY